MKRVSREAAGPGHGAGAGDTGDPQPAPVPAPQPSYGALQLEVDNRQSKRNELEEEVAELKSKKKALEKNDMSVVPELFENKKEYYNMLNASINELNASINELNASINAIRSQMTAEAQRATAAEQRATAAEQRATAEANERATGNERATAEAQRALAEATVPVLEALAKDPKTTWMRTTSTKTMSCPSFFKPDFVNLWKLLPDDDLPDDVGLANVQLALMTDFKRLVDATKPFRLHQETGLRNFMNVVLRAVHACVTSYMKGEDGFCFVAAEIRKWYEPELSSTREPDIVHDMKVGGKIVKVVMELKTNMALRECVNFHDDGYWRGCETGVRTNKKGKEVDTINCSLTQLCMYLKLVGARYGVLTTYDATWFVRLSVDEAGNHGVDVTKQHLRTGKGADNSLSTALALFWFYVTVARDREDFKTEDWKKFDDDQVEAINTKNREDDEAHETRDEQSTRTATRSSDRIRKAAGAPSGHQYADLPVFSLPNNKAITLNCGGGFSDVVVNGEICFVKIGNANPEINEEIEEMKHEADMYNEHAALQGDALPHLVYAGDVNRGRYVVITTQSGHSLDSDAGRALVDKYGADVVADRARAALDALHSRGVLHGDVALRNFVIDENGNVKIIDLGRATTTSPSDKVKVDKEKGELEYDFKNAFGTKRHWH